jgi:hypothetical protein
LVCTCQAVRRAEGDCEKGMDIRLSSAWWAGGGEKRSRTTAQTLAAVQEVCLGSQSDLARREGITTTAARPAGALLVIIGQSIVVPTEDLIVPKSLTLWEGKETSYGKHSLTSETMAKREAVPACIPLLTPGQHAY